MVAWGLWCESRIQVEDLRVLFQPLALRPFAMAVEEGDVRSVVVAVRHLPAVRHAVGVGPVERGVPAAAVLYFELLAVFDV